MHIGSNMVWAPVRTDEGSRAAPAASQSGTSSVRHDVRTAKNAALSALNNERFHAALELLANNPAVSDTVLQLQSDGGASADQKSVISAYGENGD
ncbi:hypothetical protein ASD44_07035 [Mesorhizobium sp. Root554]|nr:hypothetical protein ASD27_07040 [Mesorhizobium sp. Root1471]KQZ36368.1 hypothetical protein ASD44_07035 [Mesorhizobium sp. Root554]